MNISTWHAFALGITVGVITISSLAWGLEQETTFHKIIYNMAQGLFAVIGAALAGIFAFKAAATQIANTNRNIEKEKEEKFRAAFTTLPLAISPLQAIAERRAVELANGKAPPLKKSWELDENKIIMIKEASLYNNDNQGQMLKAVLELYFECEREWQNLSEYFLLTAAVNQNADRYNLEQENGAEKYFSLFAGDSADCPRQQNSILNWVCLYSMCEIISNENFACDAQTVKRQTLNNMQSLKNKGYEKVGIKATRDEGYDSFINRLQNGKANGWPKAIIELETV